MAILTDKLEVDRTNAALLVEELVEIYTTPSPKGWREAKKVIGIDWLDDLLQQPGSNIYTWNQSMNPTQVRLVTIFAIRENIPNLR